MATDLYTDWKACENCGRWEAVCGCVSIQTEARLLFEYALRLIYQAGAKRAIELAEGWQRSYKTDEIKGTWILGEVPTPIEYYYFSRNGVQYINFSYGDLYRESEYHLLSRERRQECPSDQFIKLIMQLDELLLNALNPWFKLKEYTYRYCESPIHKTTAKTFHYNNLFKENYFCSKHAGLWMCDTCIEKLSLAERIQESKQPYIDTDKKKTEREKMTASLRFKILERDGFKCKACGANPRDDSDVVLHVDHILPIDKDGLTVDDNLQTLCAKCNLAKSNKIIQQMELW